MHGPSLLICQMLHYHLKVLLPNGCSLNLFVRGGTTTLDFIDSCHWFLSVSVSLSVHPAQDPNATVKVDIQYGCQDSEMLTDYRLNHSTVSCICTHNSSFKSFPHYTSLEFILKRQKKKKNIRFLYMCKLTLANTILRCGLLRCWWVFFRTLWVLECLKSLKL